MAGKIERGFDPDDDENSVLPVDAGMDGPATNPFSTFEVIQVDTPDFKAELLNMTELPGMQVVDMLTTSGVEQMLKITALFFLAVQDPKKGEEALGLSYRQLQQAVGQWVKKSGTTGMGI